VHATRGVGLDSGDLRDALLDLLDMLVVTGGFIGAPTRHPGQHHGDRGKKRERDAPKARKRFATRD
jgi:hypothetical protein